MNTLLGNVGDEMLHFGVIERIVVELKRYCPWLP